MKDQKMNIISDVAPCLVKRQPNMSIKIVTENINHLGHLTIFAYPQNNYSHDVRI